MQLWSKCLSPCKAVDGRQKKTNLQCMRGPRPGYLGDGDSSQFLHCLGEAGHDVQHLSWQFGCAHLPIATGNHSHLVGLTQGLADLFCHLVDERYHNSLNLVQTCSAVYRDVGVSSCLSSTDFIFGTVFCFSPEAVSQATCPPWRHPCTAGRPLPSLSSALPQRDPWPPLRMPQPPL